LKQFALIGVTATGTAGTLRTWEDVNTTEIANWTPVNDSETPGWTDVNASGTTTWYPIAA